MKISIQFTLIFLLLFSFATILYCHDQGVLKGEWLLDDKGSITMNPVVLGAVPFEEIWTRDFWGHHHLADENSHKSWRYVSRAVAHCCGFGMFDSSMIAEPNVLLAYS